MWPRIGSVPTYTVCYTAAVLLAYVAYWRVARRYALGWRVWLPISMVSSIGGIVGGKILYDLLNSTWDWRALLTLKHYLGGGYWGGLLASLLLAVPAAWSLTPRKRAALDLVALAIPLPFVLAKLGCFCNGCCYGRSCALPWAVVYPSGSHHAPAGVPVHPTQLYEIVGILAFLWVVGKLDRRRWQGTMLLWFLAIEGATVATCECFRGDFQEHVCLGPVTLSQLLALIAAIVSLVLLTVWARRFPHAPDDSSGGTVRDAPVLWTTRAGSSGEKDTLMKQSTSVALQSAGIIPLLLIYAGFALHHYKGSAPAVRAPSSARLITSGGVNSYCFEPENPQHQSGPFPVIICIGNDYLQPDRVAPVAHQLGKPVILIWCGLLTDLADDTQVDDPAVWQKKRSEFRSLLKRYQQIPGFDERRVYLTGFSFTGAYAWMLAYDDPQRYAGVVAMSAVCYPKQIQERLEAAKTLPAVVVRGENDKLLMLRRADEERTGRTLESLNPASRFIIKPREGHSEMTNYWAENLRYVLQFKRGKSSTK